MTTINITPMAPGEFGVEVTEGYDTTGHLVQVSEDFLDTVFDGAADAGGQDPDLVERLVRESFEFLLEREPANAIRPEFALEEIAGYFPEYPDEIRRRLS